jgi:ubiquinone/menaquinone biosynthesis C-methylase UbiE
MIDPLMATLIAEGVLRCSRCGGRLRARATSLDCTACAADYPLKGGVADLVPGYGTQAPRAVIPPNFVTSVISALGLPDDLQTREGVMHALDDTSLVTGDGALTAEIADLADRIGVGDSAAPVREEHPPNAPARRFAFWPRRDPAPDPRAGNIALLRHYLGATLPADASLLRSFRIANRSPLAWEAARDSGLAFVTEWTDSRARALPALTRVTPLATSVSAGEQTTAIVALQTPAEPDTYTLRIRLTARGQSMGGAAAFAIPVAIGPPVPLPTGLTVASKGLSYADDHDRANRMLWLFLERPGRRPLRVLEIGGGIHPQSVNMTHMGHAILAADISAAMGQLGRLSYRAFATSPLERGLLAFIACDATSLPLASATVDGVVMYASFHHFADPVALLAEFRRVLVPGGFVALMCEPCAPDPEEATYLRDLRKGINEQNFAPEEYLEIFSRAAMRIIEGRIDGGSLKVFLTAD